MSQECGASAGPEGLRAPACNPGSPEVRAPRVRIRRHLLNDPAVERFGAGGNAARKLCDLVPMWPALFPELSSRHRFLGVTEHDMLPGNLSAEFARLLNANPVHPGPASAHASLASSYCTVHTIADTETKTTSK